MAMSVIATVMVGEIDHRQLARRLLSLGAIFIAVVDNMMVLRGYTTSGPRILSVGLIIVASIAVFARRRGEGPVE
jgi:hypothetical protein